MEIGVVLAANMESESCPYVAMLCDYFELPWLSSQSDQNILGEKNGNNIVQLTCVPDGVTLGKLTEWNLTRSGAHIAKIAVINLWHSSWYVFINISACPSECMRAIPTIRIFMKFYILDILLPKFVSNFRCWLKVD